MLYFKFSEILKVLKLVPDQISKIEELNEIYLIETFFEKYYEEYEKDNNKFIIEENKKK